MQISQVSGKTCQQNGSDETLKRIHHIHLPKHKTNMSKVAENFFNKIQHAFMIKSLRNPRGLREHIST